MESIHWCLNSTHYVLTGCDSALFADVHGWVSSAVGVGLYILMWHGCVEMAGSSSYQHVWEAARKHEVLNQCWVNVSLASQTVGQHYPDIGSTPRVCWGVWDRIRNEWNSLSGETLVHSQQTRDVAQCWASVADRGPTLPQHWLNVSCLLDYQVNKHETLRQCLLIVEVTLYPCCMFSVDFSVCSLSIQ